MQCSIGTFVFKHSMRGALAEWLGKGLQNPVHRFKSGTRLHVIYLRGWWNWYTRQT